MLRALETGVGVDPATSGAKPRNRRVLCNILFELEASSPCGLLGEPALGLRRGEQVGCGLPTPATKRRSTALSFMIELAAVCVERTERYLSSASEGEGSLGVASWAA